jgi:hypothetical protein
MLSLRVALVENKVNHFMAPSRYSAEKSKQRCNIVGARCSICISKL